MYKFVLILFIICFYYIGLKYPDIDLKLRKFGINHRNMLTHSFFLSLLLLYLNVNGTLGLYWQKHYDISGTIISAFSVGTAIHLLYDLFPDRFSGTALIQIPYMKKAFGKRGTILWLLISCFVLFSITVYYTNSIINIFVLICCIIITIFLKRKHENGLFMVIILFVLLLWSAIYFKQNIVEFINYAIQLVV